MQGWYYCKTFQTAVCFMDICGSTLGLELLLSKRKDKPDLKQHIWPKNDAFLILASITRHTLCRPAMFQHFINNLVGTLEMHGHLDKLNVFDCWTDCNVFFKQGTFCVMLCRSAAIARDRAHCHCDVYPSRCFDSHLYSMWRRKLYNSKAIKNEQYN